MLFLIFTKKTEITFKQFWHIIAQINTYGNIILKLYLKLKKTGW
jgi:hypothetical protein